MAEWERTEHRRYRYSNGHYLTPEVQPTPRHRHRRSGSPKRRRTSLHRGYHSDNEARRHQQEDLYSGEDDEEDTRGLRETRFSRRQHPSPPRAFNIEVPRIHAGRQRRLSSPPSPVQIQEQKHPRRRSRRQLPEASFPATARLESVGDNRRFSAPNLTGPLMHQGLARHPSAPKSYGRGGKDNIIISPSERPQSAGQQGHKKFHDGGASSEVPPPYAAADSNLGSVTPGDPKSVNGHRLSIASNSGSIGPRSYCYEPLGPRQFRLVKILPETMSNMRCEIVTQSLDYPCDYIAISYAWGDPDDKTEITLEHDVPDEYHNTTRQRVSIQVTVSLHGALGALRHQDEDVYVWVDSLSIDQQNKDELSRQVQLMSYIYGRATSVAIWLGPEIDNSHSALQLMEELANVADTRGKVYRRISDDAKRSHFSALVSLFEREYWNRLWVVQEVYIPEPAKINVYCGHDAHPWAVYKAASDVLRKHKRDIESYFPGSQDHSSGQRVLQQQYSFAQVLAHQGPGSLLDGSLRDLGEQPLLAVMRSCRSKLTADPRDKVYGILGLLSDRVRKDFPVNYRLSVKKLYLDVVDHVLSTTKRLDVLCESIHFPPHVGSAGLPTWCPDWSHVPATKALQSVAKFSASGTLTAKPRFLDQQRRKLEISAIKLDTIEAHGVAVGTFCTSSDYLMAFLNWRAIMLDTVQPKGRTRHSRLLDDFSRTLCLDQVPDLLNRSHSWSQICHHVFAWFLRDRLPQLHISQELKDYADATYVLPSDQRRQILQSSFGKRMMGRSFCVTKKKYIGMGSGFMDVDDVVVIPLGCNTPILLRPEGANEYRYVGDVYIHGYMYGEVVAELDASERKAEKFILH